MPSPETQLLTPEFLELIPTAATNYIESIRLPENGPVLFIMDKQNATDKNVAARRVLTQSIAGMVRQNGHQTLTLEFDESTSYEEMFKQTGTAISTLEEENSNQQRITTVYLGDQWQNRWGMYDAVGEFSTKTRESRIAISVQANIDDITVMSQITPVRLEQIGKGIDYFEHFFNTHPRGKLIIKTEKEGITGELTVRYDTNQAPFAHDRGILDDEHPNPISTDKGPIFNGGNVLGAESYASPYPFEESQGSYVSKEGIKFTVVDGYLVAAENWEEVYESLEDKQKQIIDILNQRARLQQAAQEFEDVKVPLSEIGLGAFRIAGIDDLPAGCSTLMAEKLGPHGGEGKAPGETSEEQALLEAAKRVNFTHTDFVMPPNTTIEFISDEGDTEQLYPPTVDIS